jgi:2-dehydro-3-deoxyglucarate aldolase
VLDTGVRNVLVPRVETAAEVERAVEAANFHYDGGIGDRGMGAGRANLWGGLGGDYVESEDASTQVGVMIENTTAVDNLDEILAVPDLGFVFIGPADLSHSLGRPGEITDSTVQETMADIEETVTSAGVPLGSFVYDATDPGPTIEKGYQLLVSGFDANAIRQTFGEILERTDEARPGRDT